MFLLRDKLITQGEKRETSTKTRNETMLRDKLRVFVSRISLPLTKKRTVFMVEREHTSTLCKSSLNIFFYNITIFVLTGFLSSFTQELNTLPKFN